MQIFAVPALRDNYVYILKSKHSVIAVDPSEADPVFDFLTQQTWSLDFILNTHHHYDHVGGNLPLKAEFGCRILCSEYDLTRIPGADEGLADGARVQIGGIEIQALTIPGHTLGHTAYYLSTAGCVFVGDTLFSAGCGRLFEGSPAQMWASLQRLASLPQETRIYCGHEYTVRNLGFASEVEPDNEKVKEHLAWAREQRAHGRSTLPTTLLIEKEINPFLRAREPSLKRHLGMENASDLDVFTRLREMRDRL